MTQQVAHIRPRKLKGRLGFIVTTPFSRTWGDQVKAMIPRSDRFPMFDYPPKGWWIAAEHLDVVVHLAREAFGFVDVVDRPGADPVTYTPAGERLHQESLL